MNTHYQGLGHIAIHTKDIGESIAFYEKLGGALHKQASMPTPNGEKGLALVEFGGFLLELIQSPVPVPMTEGNIPHFAVYVDDLDAAAAAVKAAGALIVPQAEIAVEIAAVGGIHIEVIPVFIRNSKALFHGFRSFDPKN